MTALPGNRVRNVTDKDTCHEYAFQNVFDMKCDNNDLFETMCMPMIKKVLDGYNAVLIAYGQTGFYVCYLCFLSFFLTFLFNCDLPYFHTKKKK